MNDNKLTLYISGMHCASCGVIVSDVFTEHKNVQSFSLDGNTVLVQLRNDADASGFIVEINEALKVGGYVASTTKTNSSGTVLRTTYGILIGIVAFVLIIVFGKKLGQLGFGESANSYVTAFLIGIVASVSTCAAIVGGIVMTIASAHETKKATMRSLTAFHTGRIIGFALLGALLGAFGSVFRISSTASATLAILAGLIMAYFGFKNLGIIKNSNGRIAQKVVSFVKSFEGASSFIAYALLGSVTFFVPCGFTQGMQALALASGKPLTGLLVMLMFVLGTTPVLSLIGFGFGFIQKGKWSDVIHAAAGALILGFAVINVWGGLAVLDVIRPLGI